MDNWDDELVPDHLIDDPVELQLSHFCNAAQMGDIDKIRSMLERKRIKNVNQQSPKRKETALHYACRGGQMEVVKFLIEMGADVNIKDVRGKISLHLTCSGGFLDIARYLVDNGAELTFVDKYNRSCMHWAALNKRYDIVEYLLQIGAPVTYTMCNNWQPLHEAVKAGELKIAELLIEHGAVVNAEVKAGKSHPVTPLHIAAREGHLDCLNLLLKHKAMVNAFNQGKQTPLHEAAFKGSSECCKQLIIHGADPHARNNQERTPLLESCNQGHIKCAIYLLDAGSLVNRVDRIDQSSLHHLLNFNKDKLSSEQLSSFTDVLLQYGANPTLVDANDETPIMIANMMIEKDVLDVIYTAMEKPRSLLHLHAKIACRKIVGCDYEKAKDLQLPRNLQVYLLQNTSYFSGW